MGRFLIIVLGLMLFSACNRPEKPDFHYKVLDKTYTQGQLVETGEIDRLGGPVKKRIDPKFVVHFKGVESGREYPGLEVKESAFRSLVQGAIYDREVLNNAKK